MISVIVPVYNGEKFIGKFIDEFLKQTYKDFEMIIINDGSKDNTHDILIEKKKHDNRIRVFEFENHGVSWSRNYGISQINGDSFTFIDCDDNVDINYLEELNKYLTKDIEAVYCQVKVVDEKMVCKQSLSIKSSIYTAKEILNEMLDFKNISTGPVAKLFKTELISDSIQFPKYKIYEDLLFNFNLLDKLNNRKIYFTNDTSYYYIHRDNVGAMSNFKKSPTIDVINAIDEIVNKIQNFENYDYLFNRLTSQIMIYAVNCKIENDKDFIKNAQFYLRKHIFDLIKNKSLNKNEKILYLIYMLSFNLFEKVR